LRLTHREYPRPASSDWGRRRHVRESAHGVQSLTIITYFVICERHVGRNCALLWRPSHTSQLGEVLLRKEIIIINSVFLWKRFLSTCTSLRLATDLPFLLCVASKMPPKRAHPPGNAGRQNKRLKAARVILVQETSASSRPSKSIGSDGQ
jgi:hypothetical protein